jgi:cysteine desulfurase
MGLTPQRYFDHNATTRVAPEVVEAMMPYLTEYWGNPSSAYLFGHELGEAIEKARAGVAELLGAEPREIVFTSGGTESINSVFHSATFTQPGKRHIITTAVEHSATLKCCEFLARQGFAITSLPVNQDGLLDLADLETAIRDDTALVSVMWANNETGVIFPIGEIARICRGRGALCHVDAVQAAGKVAVRVGDAQGSTALCPASNCPAEPSDGQRGSQNEEPCAAVDFLSLSGHKLRAPKGVGALYVRRGVKYQPYLLGGGQENGRRGGTENVAGIVGFGRAAELAQARLPEQRTRVRALRDRLEKSILAQLPGTQRNGAEEPRLPNTSNLAFPGVEADGVLLLLDQAGICASSGSACKSGSLDPSHVLLAMGCSAARARSSLRFSIGQENTDQDVDCLLEILPSIVARLRELGAGG